MVAAAITNADTIMAVGTPKNVQLSARSGSRRKRVVAYQMKKSSAMSPGRSLEPNRRATHRRTAAPTSPEMDSYRNSGWKCWPRVASGIGAGRAGVGRHTVLALNGDAPRGR